MLGALLTTEKKQLKDLYKICFPEDGADYISYFFDNKYDPKKTILKKINGRAVSALHLVDKYIYIKGHAFFAPFIVAAGTLPAFRGNKIMERLILETFKRLRGAGVCLVALNTHIHGYYKRHGFITYSFVRDYKINATKELPYKLVELKSTSMEAAELLVKTYKNFVREYNGYTVRDKAYFIQWQNEVFADGGKIFFVKSGGKYIGYILTDGGQIAEFCLADFAVAASIKEFDGLSAKILGGGNDEQYNMIRLINPAVALENISFDKSVTRSVSIKIADAQIAENNTALRLNIAGGKCRVEKADGFDYTVDIARLTALIMGVGDTDGGACVRTGIADATVNGEASGGTKNGGVAGGGSDDLSELFYKCDNFVFDKF
jgi:predicted acetyltransferase